MKKPKKAAAPSVKTHRSVRLTISARTANADKFNLLWEQIDAARVFKNKVSEYCHRHLAELLFDYYSFVSRSKDFSSEVLNSWERQALFQEVAGHYAETVKRKLRKARWLVSSSKPVLPGRAAFLFLRLRSTSGRWTFDPSVHVDELRLFEAKLLSDEAAETEPEKKNKILGKIERNRLDIQHAEAFRTWTRRKPDIFRRLLALCVEKKSRLLGQVRLSEYETGTHARHRSNANIRLIDDAENSEFRYWVRMRKHAVLTGKEPVRTKKNALDYEREHKKWERENFLFLPLTVSRKEWKRLNLSFADFLSKDNPQLLVRGEQVRRNPASRKIHLVFATKTEHPLDRTLRETDETILLPTPENTLGVDVNVKHNLLTDSAGRFYADLHKEGSPWRLNLNRIVELQAVPTDQRTEKQRFEYEKSLRRNESFLRNYLARALRQWKNEGIRHLVLEDLHFIGDKSSYLHKDIQVKYSRLGRLLRIAQVKHWVSDCAEKHGLFTHFAAAAHTSRECSKCRDIRKSNRPTQEAFLCRACGHSDNADVNAALVIRERFLDPLLRNKLHDRDVRGRFRPKDKDPSSVMEILLRARNPRVVTELLSNP